MPKSAQTLRKFYEQNALESLRQAYLAKHEDARETFIADALRYIALAEDCRDTV